MRFAFHNPPVFKKPELLSSVIAGAARHGDVIEVSAFPQPITADGAIIFGIAGISKAVFDAYRAAGKHTILLDKGYTRDEHLRVAVDDFQPLAYLQRSPRDAKRFARLQVRLRPYRRRGRHVLFDGASEKFCRWKNLGSLAEWGASTVAMIRAHTDRPIVYRPRPTFRTPVAVPGATLSQALLQDDLANAHVVVSYGGNIGFDAVVSGVPHFAIGDSAARPLSETDWSRLDIPRVPTARQRHQWCCDIAYCQWTAEEFRSGEAWAHIRPLLAEPKGLAA